MVTGAPVVAGIGWATPGTSDQDTLWSGFFDAHYDGARVARRLFSSVGVQRRHAAVNPLVEDCSTWPTSRRMQRYQRESLPLGKEAVTGALAAADVDPADVAYFAVASCTGYATPGLDVLLARDVGMPADTQRLFVGHMGCYAALPGLGAVVDFVAHRGGVGVLLCLELTSLHLQPRGDAADPLDTEQVVSHALFSDAAVAVVVRPSAPGLSVVDVRSVTDVAHAGHMTWDVTDLGFRMGLSAAVPDVLAAHVRGAVDDLLAAHGLAIPDVAGWAVHPGGPRILDVVRDRLGIDEAELTASRTVLREHGNCSSATVLLVLDELVRTRRPAAGEHLVALAFGPGLTLYAALLRAG